MARFKYLGGAVPSWVTGIGKTYKLTVPSTQGIQTFLPVAPAEEFVRGQDMGYDITDVLALKVMRACPMYEEIV